MRIAVQGWIRAFSGIAMWTGAALAGAAAVHADGGALYRWETPDGTIAFTDDAKRVPEHYQGAVETIDRGMLTDYGRYTATDRDANSDAARRLAERLDALRAVNGVAGAGLDRVESAPRGVAPAVGERSRRDVSRRVYTRNDGSTYSRYYDQTVSSALALPVDPNDPHPVVTEQTRVSVPGRLVTETVTVVRQGDRVLSVERPESAEHLDTWPSLTDLTE